eukprot:CAMPEP_0194534582 /NCGR_PEP_ID=MMETSP0253-20130528/72841_1 /TAXON_ID=2966 /ORGANISM="Noctiluca scintillans" /LENGTH=54 /DNA_ID=CAMNT_0039380265 /DNA_START=54 /DNA_END=215 /DNA_ORIENTATION=-
MMEPLKTHWAMPVPVRSYVLGVPLAVIMAVSGILLNGQFNSAVAVATALCRGHG